MNPRRLGSRIWTTVAILACICPAAILADEALNEDLAAKSSYGDAEEVSQLLLRGAHANAVDEAGVPAIHRAAQGGNAETLQLLIEKGADANRQGPLGWSPLSRAAFTGNTDAI